MQPNHLVGLKRRFLKLKFLSVEDLMKAKRDIMPAVRKNKEREKSQSVYDPSLFSTRYETQCGNFSSNLQSITYHSYWSLQIMGRAV